MLRQVRAVRYVLPFREGSSVPALVEGDDLGMYVVKLRGAGQGPKALTAELISGELARGVGLNVPEIVLIDLPKELSASEPDPELCIPLEASAGLNIGLDYLPASITFDAVAGPLPDASTASRVVMFDAFVANVDRTARNPNLLEWHRQLWLIDHGASLYFHHGWSPDHRTEGSGDPFVEVRDHVLLKHAAALPAATFHLQGALSEELIDAVVQLIPSVWLEDPRAGTDAQAERDGYLSWLRARRAAFSVLLSEAERARARLI